MKRNSFLYHFVPPPRPASLPDLILAYSMKASIFFCAEQILPPLHLSKSFSKSGMRICKTSHRRYTLSCVFGRVGWSYRNRGDRTWEIKNKMRAHKFMHEFHDEQCAHTRWRSTTWMRADWNERQRRRHVREHECIFMSLNFNYWHGGHLKFHFVFFFALYAAVGLLLPPVWARREKEQQQRRRRGRAARKT